MKITLLTVGKTDRDWVRQGLEIYVSRLRHYIPFTLTEIPELKNSVNEMRNASGSTGNGVVHKGNGYSKRRVREEAESLKKS